MLLLYLLLSIAPSIPQLHYPPTPWPPPPSSTRWIAESWLVETGWLCRHSPSTHSSVDLGVVLRISFAAGANISIYKLCSRKKIVRIRVSSASLLHFASSYTSLCGHFGFGLIRRLQLEKEVSALELNFGEEACGLCSVIWSVGFLCCTKSMGAQISKTAGKEEAAVEKPAEGAAVAAKANGQVNYILIIQVSNSQAAFCSVLAMCCVNGVLHVPCSIPTLTGIQGKWPHVTIFTGESIVPI